MAEGKAKGKVEKRAGLSTKQAEAHFDGYFKRQVAAAKEEAEKRHDEERGEKRVEVQRAAQRKAEEVNFTSDKM